MRTSVHAVIALVMASAFGAAHASTDLSKASELAKANGGYSNASDGDGNRKRERLWLSPGCVERQAGLFG